MGNPQARKTGRKTPTLQTFSHDTHFRKTTSLLDSPKGCALCEALTRKEGEEDGTKRNQIKKKNNKARNEMSGLGMGSGKERFKNLPIDEHRFEFSFEGS